jgi:hypothetical protein
MASIRLRWPRRSPCQTRCCPPAASPATTKRWLWKVGTRSPPLRTSRKSSWVSTTVVFGLTLTVNWLAGYTINRVTLFALILALGMLVDDPIVDVENIARHFDERKRASRGIVLDAVAEIRPPLISATLAVIVSFLPLFAITGMMGPYMSPMALGVPVAMAMSMLVAFTITPWLAYHVLGGRYPKADEGPATEDGIALRRIGGRCCRGDPNGPAGRCLADADRRGRAKPATGGGAAA